MVVEELELCEDKDADDSGGRMALVTPPTIDPIPRGSPPPFCTALPAVILVVLGPPLVNNFISVCTHSGATQYLITLTVHQKLSHRGPASWRCPHGQRAGHALHELKARYYKDIKEWLGFARQFDTNMFIESQIVNDPAPNLSRWPD